MTSDRRDTWADYQVEPGAGGRGGPVGTPHYGRLADLALEEARQAIAASAMLMIGTARRAVDAVRPGGTLIFMSGTAARRPGSS